MLWTKARIGPSILQLCWLGLTGIVVQAIYRMLHDRKLLELPNSFLPYVPLFEFARCFKDVELVVLELNE